MQSQYEKLRSISHGSVRPNLNANDIINYEIQLPTLAEQKTIVSKIHAIEDEITSLKAICDEAPARKKAILHRELIEGDKQESTIETVETDTEKVESRVIILPEYREGCIPLYTLNAACGAFEDEEKPETDEWIDVTGHGFTPDKDRYFVVRAKGESMLPRIKDGDLCVFEWANYFAGTRNGEIVLARTYEFDPEFDGKYTIKKYSSEKVETEDSWRHVKIELHPLNHDPKYSTIEVHEDMEKQIIGFLKCVL